MNAFLLGVVLAAAGTGASPVPSTSPKPNEGVPAAAASRVFARARELCKRDDGRLWGVSLCVPMMLADPQTHQAVANVAIAGSKRDGDVYRLTLPDDVLVSNAPTDYAGTSLAELIWPMSGNADFRDVELMHESFHIVQPKLGFKGYAGTGSITGDAFLDTQAGRIWLRGELHALRAALQSTGAARKQAVSDAIAMRLYRDSLSPATAEAEREQDIMEGLAEGTGIDAGLTPERRIPYALFDMSFVEAQPSYARAFPYATGPAYTELLDAARPGWRRAVTPASDIARMTMRAYGLDVTTPPAAQAQSIIARYDGATIESQETARAARKAALAAKYKREFTAGSTIALPMTHFKIAFNPRDIEALEPLGSVYHTLTVAAPWGTIVVSGGDAMISKDFRTLYVVTPPTAKGSVIHGDGWTLTLATGYTLIPNPKKPASYTIAPPPPSP